MKRRNTSPRRIKPENGRAILMRVLSWLAFAQITAAFWCLTSQIVWKAPVEGWLRGLGFALPVALSYAAGQTVKKPMLFAGLTVLAAALAWLILGSPVGAVAALALCLLRLRAALTASQSQFPLDAPSPLGVLVFVPVIGISMVEYYPEVQRMTVLSAILYLLLLTAYWAAKRIDRYFSVNRGVAHFPAKRIRRLSGGSMAAFFIALTLLLIPVALRVPGTWHLPSNRVNYDFEHQVLIREEYPPPELEDGRQYGGEAAPIAAGIAGAFAVFGGVRLTAAMRGVGKTRTYSVREPGITEEAEALEKPSARPPLDDPSPNGVIRRQYYRAVVRKAKISPQAWLSPTEIEEAAGIDDPVLHELYEKARYGAEPCTQEDLRSLKRRKRT